MKRTNRQTSPASPSVSIAASHTPGPWHVAHSPTYGEPFVTNANGKLCLTGSIGPKDSATAEANARLIAAAPDLAAALVCAEKAISFAMGSVPVSTAAYVTLAGDRDTVRAALVRAGIASPAPGESAGQSEGKEGGK